MKKLLLFSSSRVFGQEPFAYCQETIQKFWENTPEVLFIPYASNHWDTYTAWAKACLNPLGIKVKGIHESDTPLKALEASTGVFVGGGNTFLLLHTLYKFQLIAPIHQRVLAGELRYMGSSAGSNVACPSIKTTNDMPIIYPPSFVAFDLVPFNINPHYLDPDPNSQHMGETRAQRIKEFHEINDKTVVGLREGAYLEIADNNYQLRGIAGAKIFFPTGEIQEYQSPADLSFLANK